MGIIREPKGIDFIVRSRPLTKVEQAEISEFIKMRKASKLSSNIGGTQSKDKKISPKQSSKVK
ncbi:hypothetical protein [Epilithonimonas zeae]|uniref:hypothetical protein n=1 Tax=Epilithonimonas zeae TaxID=1416779 RepID=UPI00200C48BF|nr:hypothetical protein [Epilithonimonas zeae]UQB68997.1 hypothetical protein KI430_00695 [Epilithonimonas zeae]